MDKTVLGGGMLVLALMAAGTAWAQSPMSPVKPLGGPGAAKQWVEPPAADKPDAPPSSSAADAGNAAEKPETKQAEDNRRPRSPQRAAARGIGSTASRLNRQELSRLRSGSSSYYSGFYSGYGYYGQPAYSYSGY